MRRWRAAHPEQQKAARDGWDTAHPDSSNARRKRYAQRHPEVRRLIDRTRRARHAGADGQYTAAEWRDLVAKYGGRCAYCGDEGALQVDHRIPLARGGGNSVVNILPRMRTLQSTQASDGRRGIPRARLAAERAAPQAGTDGQDVRRAP